MKKYFVLLFLLGVFIFSSFVVLADDVYNDTDDEGNIIVFPFKAVVRGQTAAGAMINLGELSQEADTKGFFEFINLNEGTYKLVITKSGFTDYITDIKVKKGTIIELGKIELEEGTEDNITNENNSIDTKYQKDNDNYSDINNKSTNQNEDYIKNNDDTLDVTDPDYINKINIDKNEKDKSNLDFLDSFSVGNSDLNIKLAYLFLKFDKNIKHGGSVNSHFESNGFLTELEYKYPFSYKDHRLFLGLETSFITGVNGVEKVYDNNVLDSTRMIDFSTKNFAGRVGYIFDVYALGDVYVSLGRSYDYLETGISSFELSDNPELYTKDYRYSKGWSFGAGLESDLSNLGFVKPSSIFNNLNFGLDYEYTLTYTDITSTKEFSSMLVEGYKSDFDIWLKLNTKYQIILGYKLLNYYNQEKVDGLLTWPDYNSTIHGPYFEFTIPF